MEGVVESSSASRQGLGFPTPGKIDNLLHFTFDAIRGNCYTTTMKPTEVIRSYIDAWNAQWPSREG